MARPVRRSRRRDPGPSGLTRRLRLDTRPPADRPPRTGPAADVKANLVSYANIPFVLIEPGTFSAGSPATEPGHQMKEAQHFVRIPHRFALSQTELTVEQYWRTTDPTHNVPPSLARQPMTKVTWAEAVEFCKKLTKKLRGRTFRLPTEDEWEYACRAGSTGMFANQRIAADPHELEKKYAAGNKQPLERRAHSCFCWGRHRRPTT